MCRNSGLGPNVKGPFCERLESNTDNSVGHLKVGDYNSPRAPKAKNTRNGSDIFGFTFGSGPMNCIPNDLNS